MRLKVQVWDTAENDRYNALIPMYLRSADIIFYFINLNDEDGIRDCENKMAICHDFADVKRVIVGNRR